MANAIVDFNVPDLAARVEDLSQADIDQLPFGVILLDREGTVLFYSETEARQSGYNRRPTGENFFEVARCMAGDDFRGRILRAMELGLVDVEFGWSGDFAEPRRGMRMRVQSARQGGVWILIERDPAVAELAAAG